MILNDLIQVEPIYISAGCNRCPKALDWGGRQNQLISCVSNSIALYSSQEPFEIKCTFNKHTDRINCVKWISFTDLTPSTLFNKNEFISASKDKTIVVWQGTDFKYEPAEQLEGHTNNICVIDGMYYSNDQTLNTLIASASVDSTVRIWKRQSDFNLNANFSCEQVISCKMNGFALALKLYLLPLSNLPLLLVGYENHKIEINVRLHNETENTDKFYCLHTLIGHEDWIRDIDVCQISTEQLLIASSSQDNYIRLWKLDSSLKANKEDIGNKQLMIEENSVKSEEELKTSANLETNNGEQEDEEDEEQNLKKSEKTEEELRLKSSLFTVHSKKLDKYVQYSMNLESVLYGHEDWIYTVKFHPRINNQQPLVLISASIDKTIVVWKYDEQNSIWIDIAKAGDIGGNTLGFYGATFEPNGNYIVAHGYQGALHLWKRNSENESLTAAVINGGHFDLVEDLCWEPDSQFLVSTSKDQTTRFHSYWKGGSNDRASWHELGRPQIHGYDLTCVAFLERFKFVSGADEKLLRVFESPKVFLQNLHKLNQDESLVKLINESTKLGASVPALGLSNKAIYEENQSVPNADKKVSLADELYKEACFNIINLNKPPTEEHLLQNTLWPEMQKLYGHGFEIFSVAVEPKSKIIASACKASKPEHATIILWKEQENNNFKQISALKGHELTIVQMKFSNNGQYLLSVSRDRSWKLYKRKTESNNNELEKPQFNLFRFINSKNVYHTRIIWSCDWSHDDKYFVTTSRDKRVCVWNGDINETQSAEEKPIISNNSTFIELESSVTACSFAPCLISNQYLIAFGLENGKVLFYTWNSTDGFRAVYTIENRYSHHLTVKKLSFRKLFHKTDDNKTKLCLASCSDDCSVRLFEITV